MSKLNVLDDLLVRYHQLQYHQNALLRQRLNDVQTWQKKRLLETHQSLFNQKNHQALAQYFVHRLYGGPDFDLIAVQIERLIHHAHKIEHIIPASALQTGTHGIELSILAVELDEQVAQQVLRDYPQSTEITDDVMRSTYMQINQKELRLKQLKMTDELGTHLDQYVKSFMLNTAFKLCKPMAYKHHFHMMYDFIYDGLVALKPLKCTADFVNRFTEQERHVLLKVHNGHQNPFRSSS